jgi:hypothetical protein
MTTTCTYALCEGIEWSQQLEHDVSDGAGIWSQS